MHVDVTPFDDRRATRAELEAERDRLEFAIMMRDPEGNEFCLQ